MGNEVNVDCGSDMGNYKIMIDSGVSVSCTEGVHASGTESVCLDILGDECDGRAGTGHDAVQLKASRSCAPPGVDHVQQSNSESISFLYVSMGCLQRLALIHWTGPYDLTNVPRLMSHSMSRMLDGCLALLKGVALKEVLRIHIFMFIIYNIHIYVPVYYVYVCI